MTVLAISDSVLPTPSGTYSHVVARAIVTEGGVTGGSAGTVQIALASGALTRYSVNGLTDGTARTCSASCSGCSAGVSLATFKAQGVALSDTGPAGLASSSANAMAIGATGQRMLSSFAPKSEASGAVVGLILAKK